MAKPVLTQELMNAMVQMEVSRLHHEMYGTRYLLEPDGEIVLRYPDGKKGPLPEAEGLDD